MDFLYCYLVFSFLVALITTIQLFHLLIREINICYNALLPLLLFFSCMFTLAPVVFIVMLNNTQRSIILNNIHLSLNRVFKREQDI